MAAGYRFNGKRDSPVARYPFHNGTRFASVRRERIGGFDSRRECPARRKAILRTALGHGDAIADMVNEQCLAADPGRRDGR
jgi:hypothetical protein